MKVQAGQILLPGPEAIVSLLQMAAVPIIIGIMPDALVEVLVSTTAVALTQVIQVIIVKDLAAAEEPI